MLVLGKKIDYALISLAWISGREDRCVSAREIAEENDLPLPALMQILKTLHQQGVLVSTRGVKGGYQVGMNLDDLSLHELSQMLAVSDEQTEVNLTEGTHSRPLQAMRLKLSKFLRDVSVAEIIRPGKRIDVPLQNLRILDRLTV